LQHEFDRLRSPLPVFLHFDRDGVLRHGGEHVVLLALRVDRLGERAVRHERGLLGQRGDVELTTPAYCALRRTRGDPRARVCTHVQVGFRERTVSAWCPSALALALISRDTLGK
jgi:hypothetical protein